MPLPDVSMSASNTFIKICGVRDAAMAQHVFASGGDAVGFVFHAPSPRAVSIDTARDIVAALPDGVCSVALFVDADAGFVREVIREVRPTLLQFHGDESPDDCAKYGHRFWRAIRVSAKTDLLECAARYRDAERLLLDADASARGLHGGSGQGFDWSLIPPTMRQSIVLSGGLTSDSVGHAVTQIAPWGVDVSSGVEQEKGIKSRALVAQFIAQVRQSDAASQRQ